MTYQHPFTLPDGQPVVKRFQSNEGSGPEVPRKAKDKRQRAERVLDAFEAMEQRRKGRLMDDDSFMGSEDDE